MALRRLTRPQAPKILGSHTTDATISAATTITPTAGANAVLLTARAQNIRYTIDGTTPTATTGFPLEAGKTLIIDYHSSMTIKVIEETAGGEAQWQSLVYE
jgi:hypothetical protein